MTKQKKTSSPQEYMPSAEEVQAELAKVQSMDDFFGKEGVFARLFASTLEQMLEGKLTEHLGYEPYEAAGRNSGNNRNGHYAKKVRTSTGQTRVQVPRDRNGAFEPQIIARYANNPTDHWYEFLYDGTTGAEILADKIVLHFVDGERGDSDLTANGVIADPGAPAILTPATSSVHLSPTAKLTLNGVTYEDEDIIAYDKTTGVWSLFFDGSDVGLTKADVSAFELLDDGSIILSLNKAMKNLPGLPNITADDSDILRFTPTSTGATTAGTFAIWFDGSDVGLTKGREKIDAIAFAPNGDLVISTGGATSVTGPSGTLKVNDEDLLVFNDTSLGDTTAGTWNLYFDAGDVSTKLGDIVAAGIDANGDILFAPDKKWIFGVLTINTYDVARCAGPTTGANSACAAVDLFWQGAQYGFANNKYKIDGFALGE